MTTPGPRLGCMTFMPRDMTLYTSASRASFAVRSSIAAFVLRWSATDPPCWCSCQCSRAKRWIPLSASGTDGWLSGQRGSPSSTHPCAHASGRSVRQRYGAPNSPLSNSTQTGFASSPLISVTIPRPLVL